LSEVRHIVVESVRQLMGAAGLDAYIVPFTDPHQSEYIPAHFKFREWISGFTGSAGVVAITRKFAGLWTDSRYFLQAEQELKGSGIELVRLKVPHTAEYIDWLKAALPAGATVGLDNRYFPVSLIRSYAESLRASAITLITDSDLLTSLWHARPPLPGRPVFDYPVAYSGASRTDKIHRVRQYLTENHADYQFIAPLDEIAWLFNLRGSDVEFCPVFVSYAVIGLKEAVLFTDLNAIPPALREELKQGLITIRPYAGLIPWLLEIPADSLCCLAPEKTTGSVYDTIASRARILEGMNCTTALKAIKNPVETEGIRKVMIRDGIAWVKTLYWIQKTIGEGGTLTELSVARKIAAARADQKGYQGESFHPISSYGYHGAVVHYSVTEESSIPLRAPGVLLLDSGGQFLEGTTDTTRTLSLGNPTREQQVDFTLALKGTLGVSMLRFPKGTRGYQVDILGRLALWQEGKNYGHGTGHGVGFFLNVHEGPQAIGTSASGYLQVVLEPGMVTTVEPAVYKEGEYGMRTENMTLIVPDIETDYGTFYRFETLTLVPIDQTLIDKDLLTPSEVRWIDEYHDKIWQSLSGFLTSEEKEWLRSATLPLA